MAKKVDDVLQQKNDAKHAKHSSIQFQCVLHLAINRIEISVPAGGGEYIPNHA